MSEVEVPQPPAPIVRGEPQEIELHLRFDERLLLDHVLGDPDDHAGPARSGGGREQRERGEDDGDGALHRPQDSPRIS